MKKTSKLNQGFTLIELIVVFSVIVILSTVGIAAFVNYSHTQALNTAVLDSVSMLNVAKSRAMSQVKPGESCLTQSLDGYQVTISAPQEYSLYAICGGNTVLIERKNLPANISFRSGTQESFLFHILTGSVESEGTITIDGYGRTKTITVFSNGRIVME